MPAVHCFLSQPPIEPSVMADTFVGHSNAVWGLSYDGTKNSLISCSADGTVRLWSPNKKSPLLTTITAETGKFSCILFV